MPFARTLSANARHPDAPPAAAPPPAVAIMPSRTCTACTTCPPAIRQPRQQGVVTLAMTLLVLFLSSLMVFQSSAGLLFEIRTGNNMLRQKQAQEAARGGLDAALAWLVSNGSASNFTNTANWTDDATGPSGNNQKANSSIFPQAISSQTIGDYPVSVSLWRNATAANVLEIRASSSGDGVATVSERLQLGTTTTSTSTPVTLNLNTVAPIVIKGGMSGVTGNPSVAAGTTGTAIISSQSSTTINTGGHGQSGLTVTGNIKGNAFTGTAWDLVFPNTSKAEMRAAADYSTIYFYDNEIPPPNNWHTNVGTASKPGILIFDTGAGCPKLNGGVVIYGIVYYADNCGNQGWGGAKIYGSMVSERSITKLTANSQFIGWSSTLGTGTVNLPPVTSTTTNNTLAIKTASWRDF